MLTGLLVDSPLRLAASDSAEGSSSILMSPSRTDPSLLLPLEFPVLLPPDITLLAGLAGRTHVHKITLALFPKTTHGLHCLENLVTPP